jgi:hypothetical protein
VDVPTIAYQLLSPPKKEIGDLDSGGKEAKGPEKEKAPRKCAGYRHDT